jgi:cell division protein FtsZ
MNTSEIKIIGIGRAGHRVVEKISFEAIKNTDCIVCDIDAKVLEKSSIQNKMLLGTGIIKYLSIQAQVEIGMDSILNSEVNSATNLAIDGFTQIDSVFDKESKLAILISHLGGTTEAGVTPVIAQIAKKRGLFVVAIVNMPFNFEGEITKKIAYEALKKIKEDSDFVLVVNHSKIGKLYGNLSLKSSERKTDEIVIRLAKTVMSMSSENIDSLDIKLFFKNNEDDKSFVIGIGDGDGETRAKDAIELALKNTLTERDTFEEVSNVLLQINYGSSEMTIDEKREIENTILNLMKKKCSITMSVSEDISLENALSIMVIAY